jgi:hypothetical protein
MSFAAAEALVGVFLVPMDPCRPHSRSKRPATAPCRQHCGLLCPAKLT